MRDVLQVVLRDGEPDNPKLFEMAQEFANEYKLGKLDRAVRLWCVVEREGSDAEGKQNGNALPKVIGLLASESRLDITVCHVSDESCRPMLIKRAYATLMDLGLVGKYVLLFVDPEVEAFIQEKYLQRLGALPAHRWIVPMLPKVEV